MSIPAKLADLSPEWFTTVLQACGEIGSAEVTKVDATIIGEEMGFTGVVARARLIYDRVNISAPTSVVVKLPLASRAKSSSYREMLEHDQAAARQHFERCQREIRFYEELGSAGSSIAPNLYYGAVDSTPGRIVLVLEDLADARSGDALAGCTVNEARQVLRQIAQIHARWWGESQTHQLAWLPTWGANPQARQTIYQQRIEPCLRQFGDRIPAEIQELIQALRNRYAAILSALTDAPTTLIHADLHLDNVMFHPAEQHPKATIIDWQSVSRGRSAIDVMQFLTGALPSDVRRDAEDELLAQYYEALIEGGVTDYTTGQLHHDCQLALLWLLAGNVNWLGRVDLNALQGRERALVEDIVERGQLFAAIVDYEVSEILE